MTPRLLPLVLGCTTALALAGWWSAMRAVNGFQRQVDAYRAEDWHSAEERAEFAGRCAWHAYAESSACPPQHLVAPHLTPNFCAGFKDEQDAEEVLSAAWNAEMGARRA